MCGELSQERHCTLRRVMRSSTTLPTLRIIEPQLVGCSGHYAEFIRALASRCDDVFGCIEVVASARAREFIPSLGGTVPVVAHPLPRGPLSEMRAINDSLRQGRHTFVLTANASHALMADGLGWQKRADLRRFSTFVHWPLVKPSARLALALARRTRAESLFVAPTRGVLDALKVAECDHALLVNYPATRLANAPMRSPFAYLLMAGAARLNKGLDTIAELAELLSGEGRTIQLLVQVSPKHVTHHSPREAACVARLLAANYPGLVADANAPDRAQYAARYAGALVLAPYERAKFADGVSGVVLDALLHGAPVVATAGTWAGDVVERFDAGIALKERTAAHLLRSIDRVLQRWDQYAANAAIASDTLAREHDPRNLARALAARGV